jgi:hypothetical protein
MILWGLAGEAETMLWGLAGKAETMLWGLAGDGTEGKKSVITLCAVMYGLLMVWQKGG